MICLDCADPAGLAAFWAALLGGEVAPILGADAVMVKNKSTPVAAVRVPDYQPPTWPSGAIPKQVHLDLAVDDLDAAEAEAIRLGARPAGEQPHPTRWRVMLDPAGHPFCLCDWSKELPANRKPPRAVVDDATALERMAAAAARTRAATDRDVLWAGQPSRRSTGGRSATGTVTRSSRNGLVSTRGSTATLRPREIRCISSLRLFIAPGSA